MANQSFVRLLAATRLLVPLLLPLIPAPCSSAELEFLAFPEIRTTDNNGGPTESDKFNMALDVFASGRAGAARFLAEYFLSDDENHFERLQLGFEPVADTTVWVGRFHNPLGYWHTQYHHGNFLQTSISRPAITEFGVEGGYLTSHLAGLLLESNQATGEISGFSIQLAAGLGSELKSGGGNNGGSGPGLHDLDLLKPNERSHKTNLSARVAYLPDRYGTDQFGAFITHANIPAEGGNVIRANLLAGGVFANLEWTRWRLMGAINVAADEVDEMLGTESGHFAAAYAQTEFIATPSMTLYGRLEDTFSADNDPYLQLLGQYLYSSQVLGLRFDVTRHQALKLEISRNKDIDERFHRITANWSAVFP